MVQKDTCAPEFRAALSTIAKTGKQPWAPLGAQTVKPAARETQFQSLGGEDPLEKEMATYSSTLAWKIPRTEEPGRSSPWSCKESDMTE